LRSRSGRTVNSKTAIEVSTVFGCARVIGNGMAQVPFKLMRESIDGRTRLPAKDHPLYALMARRPNPWQTSFEMRQMISWHVELAGQAVVFKNRSANGRILELIPFEPGSVTVNRADDMTLTYKVRAQNGSEQEFPAEAIWHIRGPELERVRGTQHAAARARSDRAGDGDRGIAGPLHKNGVRTSGLYSLDGKVGEDQYKTLRAWIEKEHAGAANTGMPMILDRAAKWVTTQMTGVDAQHLETRRYQVEEVCRFFGVMPIMVGYSDKARRTRARSRCSSPTRCIACRRGGRCTSSRPTRTC
jgi:HK97 family phage portal protein